MEVIDSNNTSTSEMKEKYHREKYLNGDYDEGVVVKKNNEFIKEHYEKNDVETDDNDEDDASDSDNDADDNNDDVGEDDADGADTENDDAKEGFNVDHTFNAINYFVKPDTIMKLVVLYYTLACNNNYTKKSFKSICSELKGKNNTIGNMIYYILKAKPYEFMVMYNKHKEATHIHEIKNAEDMIEITENSINAYYDKQIKRNGNTEDVDIAKYRMINKFLEKNNKKKRNVHSISTNETRKAIIYTLLDIIFADTDKIKDFSESYKQFINFCYEMDKVYTLMYLKHCILDVQELVPVNFLEYIYLDYLAIYTSKFNMENKKKEFDMMKMTDPTMYSSKIIDNVHRYYFEKPFEKKKPQAEIENSLLFKLADNETYEAYELKSNVIKYSYSDDFTLAYDGDVLILIMNPKLKNFSWHESLRYAKQKCHINKIGLIHKIKGETFKSTEFQNKRFLVKVAKDNFATICGANHDGKTKKGSSSSTSIGANEKSKKARNTTTTKTSNLKIKNSSIKIEKNNTKGDGVVDMSNLSPPPTPTPTIIIEKKPSSIDTTNGKKTEEKKIKLNSKSININKKKRSSNSSSSASTTTIKLEQNAPNEHKKKKEHHNNHHHYKYDVSKQIKDETMDYN